MKTEKFKTLFKYAPKSNLKASDGTNKGVFPFYTSSSIVSKRIDKAQYYDVSLIFGNGGTASIHYCDEPFATTSHCFVAVSKNKAINPKYVYYYLFGNIHLLERGFKGAGLKNISPKYIENLDIPILPIEAQNKIVAVLDKIVSLNTKRKITIRLLDEYLVSSFVNLFGDPINNPYCWEVENIQKVTLIIKDGPFGSNLKSEHYQENGIRVIRLQNIGVNVFNDTDRAYISEEHYNLVLRNYTCVKGDVLVGTLGEPNLRACKFPNHIDKAVNKADCVQIRPDNNKITDTYLAFLLNMPGAMFLVSNYIKGQTRSRISKGMLCKINIPIPPLDIQHKFSQIELIIERLKEKYICDDLDRLFKSVIQKAFNGELNFNIDLELDALIKDIDLQKKENDLSKIVTDYAYLQRLIDKLNNQEFKEKEMYDKAKHAAFQLLKEGDKLEQIIFKTKFEDKEVSSIILSLK